jgi:hypothetical protein
LRLMRPFGPIVSTRSRAELRLRRGPRWSDPGRRSARPDDDRLAFVHDVLLHSIARRLGTRTRSPRRRHWRGRLRGSRRLSTRWSDRFIAFPHVIPPPVLFQGQGLGCLPSLIGADDRSHYSVTDETLSSPFVTKG